MAKAKTNKPKTAGYKPIDLRWMQQPRDLPLMTFVEIVSMLREPTICLGLEMRSAPLADAEFEITADSETIKSYVAAQLDAVFAQLSALDSSQVWGWSGCEVMLNSTLAGTVEIGDLLSRHANDIRAIVVDGKVNAVRFNRIEGQPLGHVTLAVGDIHSEYGPPKAIFHAHDPQAGAVYGSSILEGAFSPWCDKWLKGGALDVRRLTMVQNAISGRKMWYPDGMMEIPGHADPVPTRNVAKQIVEQIMAGGVATLPSDIDPETGKQRWNLEEAKALSGLEHILQYPKDLDIEMLRGMKIPDDVIMSQADSSGAWAGKQVPQAAFYNGLMRWLRKLIADIRRCILDYLVWFNFGPGHWYKVEPKSLAEKAMQAQKPPQGPQAARPPVQQNDDDDDDEDRGPQRMSLAAAIGQGVVDAAATVKAANGIIRMRTAEGPAPGNTAEGRWITIGGKSKGDKKHSGGFPVQIGSDGTILKSGGPKGLVGKKISEAGAHFKGMRQEHKQKKYHEQLQREADDPVGTSRSWKTIVKSQSDKWDMEPETYAKVADDVWRDTLEVHEDRESAKAYARKRLNLSAGDINRMENSKRTKDASSVKGLDMVGHSLANDFPSLGWSHLVDENSSELEEKVWELIKEGRQDPPSRLSRQFHDKVEDYLQDSLDRAGKASDEFDFDPGKFDEEHPDFVKFGLERKQLANA